MVKKGEENEKLMNILLCVYNGTDLHVFRTEKGGTLGIASSSCLFCCKSVFTYVDSLSLQFWFIVLGLAS